MLDPSDRNFCERYHFDDLGLCGRVILKQILNRVEGYALDLSVHDWDHWQDVISTVVNFQVS